MKKCLFHFKMPGKWIRNTIWLLITFHESTDHVHASARQSAGLIHSQAMIFQPQKFPGVVPLFRRCYLSLVTAQPKATNGNAADSSQKVPIVQKTVQVQHGEKDYQTYELGRHVPGSELLEAHKKYVAIPDCGQPQDPIENMHARFLKMQCDYDEKIEKLNDKIKQQHDKIKEQGDEIQKLLPLRQSLARLVLHELFTNTQHPALLYAFDNNPLFAEKILPIQEEEEEEQNFGRLKKLYDSVKQNPNPTKGEMDFIDKYESLPAIFGDGVLKPERITEMMELYDLDGHPDLDQFSSDFIANLLRTELKIGNRYQLQVDMAIKMLYFVRSKRV